MCDNLKATNSMNMPPDIEKNQIRRESFPDEYLHLKKVQEELVGLILWEKSTEYEQLRNFANVNKRLEILYKWWSLQAEFIAYGGIPYYTIVIEIEQTEKWKGPYKKVIKYSYRLNEWYTNINNTEKQKISNREEAFWIIIEMKKMIIEAKKKEIKNSTRMKLSQILSIPSETLT
jgi:hypothetical protein